MTHLSLFSGIGGIDLAAEWAGFESVAMVERDKYCQKVLAKNFPNAKIYDDVTTFNGYEYKNKIDLISAGFPCQPFSCIGKRKGASDERALFPEILRILRETNARWFLGENVPGLTTIDDGRYFGRIINEISEIGYRVGWYMYGAKDVGAVHRRNRVFIVGYTDSITGPQTDSSTHAERSQRNTWKMSNRRHWRPVRGGDWKEWGISPAVRLTSRIRRDDDGLPNRVDRLKALGNAVVPQQVYPILAEIAAQIRSEK